MCVSSFFCFNKFSLIFFLRYLFRFSSIIIIIVVACRCCCCYQTNMNFCTKWANDRTKEKLSFFYVSASFTLVHFNIVCTRDGNKRPLFPNISCCRYCCCCYFFYFIIFYYYNNNNDNIISSCRLFAATTAVIVVFVRVI